jgi:tripartite-type tricarboxylate transporter receptor subunit TctC
MMRLPRRAFLGLAAAAALPASVRSALAQAYPTRPVRLIVGYSAGGTADIVARIIAQRLTERLGQPVVVENKPGATTNIATQAVISAAPDGHTLLYVTAANATNASLYASLPFNFMRDIVPVAGLVEFTLVLVVNASLPVHSIGEFVAYARANPGKISMASFGVGTTSHLSGELLKLVTGIDTVHVPYRGGAPMLGDLVAGHIQMSIETSGAATPFIKGGQVRALAVSPAKRSALFPELPTLAESGLPGYDVTTWYGVLVPKGTPQPVRDKLYQELAQVLKSPDVIARLRDIGAEPGGEPPAQFAAFIHAETEKWIKLAKDAGIQAD